MIRLYVVPTETASGRIGPKYLNTPGKSLPLVACRWESAPLTEGRMLVAANTDLAQHTSLFAQLDVQHISDLAAKREELIKDLEAAGAPVDQPIVIFGIDIRTATMATRDYDHSALVNLVELARLNNADAEIS